MSNGSSSPSAAQQLPVIATVVALVVVAAYLVMVYLVWGTVRGAEESEWLRYADLRGGLEALAFAAAGALFGTTVQRQATQAVEKQAAEQKARADANQTSAEGGRALVAHVRSQPAPPEVLEGTPAGGLNAQVLDGIARQYGL